MLSPVEERVVAAAQTGSRLDLGGAAVRAEVLRDLLTAGHGLRLTGARVVGPLDLEGLRSGAAMRLVDCDFDSHLRLRGAELALLDLRASRLPSLSATESTIERVVLLAELRAHGPVHLGSAKVGAAVSLERARLHNPDGPALIADRIRLSSQLLLDGLTAEGTGAEGAISLVGARIDSRLSARGLRARNPAGPALVADNLQVTDTADLSQGAVLLGHGERGAVRMAGARVASLSLGGARIENPAGWAVAAHYLDAGGTVYLDRVRAVGGIRVSGARIAGRLDCADATIESSAGSALDAGRAVVSQGIELRRAVLRGRAAGPGAVQLRGVTCAADLDLRGARLANPLGPALRAAQATVAGTTWLETVELESGGIDLRDAQLAVLRDGGLELPDDGLLMLDGLTYRGLPGASAGTPPAVQDRIRLLRRMDSYAAQPYRQLAAAYQGAGHLDDARRVLIAQQDRLRDSGVLSSRWSRLRHRLFGLTLQYGYQPLRAVMLLALTLLVAIGLFLGLSGGSTAVPAGGRCAAVDRVGLAIDTTIPLVSTGARERCRPATGTGAGQALVAAGWVLTLLGWGSATLVVAGYTGLVRRP